MRYWLATKWMHFCQGRYAYWDLENRTCAAEFRRGERDFYDEHYMRVRNKRAAWGAAIDRARKAVVRAM